MSDEQPQVRAPYAITEPRFSVSPQMVTTAFELPGYRVRQNLGAHCDATEIAQGVTEVLAYGTAVVVDPLEGTGIYGS